MAVISNHLNSTLILKYQDGLTSTGAPIIRQKTLNQVNYNANQADLYEVAIALFSLLDSPLTDVLLRDNIKLLEEEEG